MKYVAIPLILAVIAGYLVIHLYIYQPLNSFKIFFRSCDTIIVFGIIGTKDDSAGTFEKKYIYKKLNSENKNKIEKILFATVSFPGVLEKFSDAETIATPEGSIVIIAYDSQTGNYKKIVYIVRNIVLSPEHYYGKTNATHQVLVRFLTSIASGSTEQKYNEIESQVSLSYSTNKDINKLIKIISAIK
jgi:hypothetical protein